MDSPAKNTVASARLDLIRGLAASFVVWDHIGKLFFDPVTPELKRQPGTTMLLWSMEQGFTAVALFFVLSGFLIGGAVKRANERGWDWPRYLIARICRLCVPLLPAFLICGLIDFAGFQMFGESTIYQGRLTHAITTHDVLAQLTPTVLFGNLCFLQTIYVPVWGSDGPLWSLGNEFWYYLYWPLGVLLLSVKRVSQRVWLTVFLLAALALTGRWLLPMFPIWVLGAVLAICKFPIKRMSSLGTGLCWAFFFGVLAVKWFVHLPEHHIPDYLTGIGFSVALVGTLLSPTAGEKTKKNWFITWSANISYTLYLVHYPLLMFFSAWLVGDRPTFAPTLRNMPMAAGLLLSAWVFATIMWWIAERNTDRVRAWAERLWHKFISVPAPA